MLLRNTANRVFALSVLPVMAANLSTAQSKAPLTVCEILAEPCRYENKRVRVQGEELPGGHGVFFSTSECPKGREVVKPTYVSLDLPIKDLPEIGVTKVEAGMADTAKRQTSGWRQGMRTFIIIEGVFQSVQDCANGHPEKAYRLGFGQDGFAKARILIQKTIDVQFRP